jgi:glycosyltransferase involved in cell wall biosynthesis
MHRYATTTPMNVLHILVGLPRGGKERLVFDICREGPSLGILSSVLAMEDGALKDDFVESGINIEISKRSFPIDWGFVRKIKRSVEENGIDVVHTHEPVEAMHAFFAIRHSRVPHVLTLHGFFSDVKNRLALRFLRSHVDTLVFVSESYRSLEPIVQHRSLATRQEVIYNGIDTKRFEGVTATLRKELGIDGNSLLAGTIAHFVSGKDPITIARALAIVMRQLPGLHFAFVGTRDPRTPDIYDLCRQYCDSLSFGSRIHFLESREDIPAILASLDLLVLSSTQETFGLVAAEAMYSGTPLLHSRIPAFLEVTGGDECAFEFTTGDAGDLAEKMGALLMDPWKRSAKVSFAKDRVQRNFTIQDHILTLREIYKEALARKQSFAERT